MEKETKKDRVSGANLGSKPVVIPPGWLPEKSRASRMKHTKEFTREDQKQYRIWIKWRSEQVRGYVPRLKLDEV